MIRDLDPMFREMHWYVGTILALNTKEQTVTWQYILLVYCHLEALALDLQRLHEGQDDQTYWTSRAVQRKTLYRAAEELHQKRLVPPEIIQILKDVANLRNSVAHKSVMGGMTAGQQVGEEIIYVNYKGAPVFDEFDEQGRIKSVGNSEHSGVNEETVRQLVADTHQAKTTLNNARKSAGGRQATRQ